MRRLIEKFEVAARRVAVARSEAQIEVLGPRTIGVAAIDVVNI